MRGKCRPVPRQCSALPVDRSTTCEAAAIGRTRKTRRSSTRNSKAMTEAANKKVVYTTDREGRSVTRLVDPSDLTNELAIGVWEPTNSSWPKEPIRTHDRASKRKQSSLLNMASGPSCPNATDLALAAPRPRVPDDRRQLDGHVGHQAQRD